MDTTKRPHAGMKPYLVMDFEDDAVAAEWMNEQAKLGYRLHTVSNAAVSSGDNFRILVPSIVVVMELRLLQ